MRLYHHIIIGHVNPCNGGMEQSVNRIAGFLKQFGDSAVALYARLDPEPIYQPPHNEFEVISIATKSSRLLEPIESKSQRRKEKDRCDFIVLKDEIGKRISEYPKATHIVISFYASTSGFIAQQIADSFSKPHIVCIRGTDINRDFRNPDRFSAISYVIGRAAHVVTTNREQADAIRHLVPTHTRIETIYNSLPDEDLAHEWIGSNGSHVRLVCDCGESSKKATHILAGAVLRLASQGIPLRLCVVGEVSEGESAYWKSVRDSSVINGEGVISYLGPKSRTEVIRLLKESDIYCSASLGEGCSNGAILPLTMGMPIVATEVGIFPEVADGTNRIILVPPGNESALTDALREMCSRVVSGKVCASQASMQKWRRVFDVGVERSRWEQVIQAVAPRRPNTVKTRQRRVLFFAHDGIGLGHLRRLSRLAGALQGPCACLMVTGHWATPMVISQSMEFVHLPSFDSLLPKKASYWGRKPFLELEREDAVAFRTRMLESVVEDFHPDAIVVDYLPLGHHGELKRIIESGHMRKYFIMRAVLDDPGNVRMDLLWGDAEASLVASYDRLLVAGDRRICDISSEYNLRPELTAKLKYIGYVSSPIPKHERDRIRAERRIPRDGKWVVCSAGSGALGENLILECEKLPSRNPNHVFDIVHGPRSSSIWPFMAGDVHMIENTRFLRFPRNLDKLHGAADVVISSGGYNSLVEAMEGGAQVICSPSQERAGAEQPTHVHRLRKFYPIELIRETSSLHSVLSRALEFPSNSPNIRADLDFDGIDRFAEIVRDDLGIGAP